MSAKIIPVDPFDLVVFGATSDLARRKLLPGLYYRDRDRQLPPEARIIGVARRDARAPGLRRADRGEPAQHVAAERCRRGLPARASSPASTTSPPTLAAGGLGRAGAKFDHGERIRVFYLATSPELFGRTCAGPRRGGPGHAQHPRGAREADRPRSGVGAGDQRRRSARCSRRTRSSASITTSARRPCRTCSVLRFANSLFEPLWNCRLHRPRADHGRREHRRRGPRRLLRRRRRAARHGAEPHAAAPLPGRDGAADPRSMPTPCATRSSRCCARSSRSRATMSRSRPCAASTAPARSTAIRRRATSTRSTPQPAAPRPSSCSRPRSRTGAGPACRSICAPASGCRRAPPRS